MTCDICENPNQDEINLSVQVLGKVFNFCTQCEEVSASYMLGILTAEVGIMISNLRRANLVRVIEFANDWEDK